MKRQLMDLCGKLIASPSADCSECRGPAGAAATSGRVCRHPAGEW